MKKLPPGRSATQKRSKTAKTQAKTLQNRGFKPLNQARKGPMGFSTGSLSLQHHLCDTQLMASGGTAPELDTQRLFFSLLHLRSHATLSPRPTATVACSGHRLNERTRLCRSFGVHNRRHDRRSLGCDTRAKMIRETMKESCGWRPVYWQWWVGPPCGRCSAEGLAHLALGGTSRRGAP